MPGPEAHRFHHIHRPIEFLTDPKRLMRVGAERERVTTVLPPPAIRSTEANGLRVLISDAGPEDASARNTARYSASKSASA